MWMIETAIGLGVALALVALCLLTCIRVLNEYQRGVIFRLGRGHAQVILGQHQPGSRQEQETNSD
jgi:regulator of protease activity HflC (stomatin/prohibitin superfamily)